MNRTSSTTAATRISRMGVSVAERSTMTTTTGTGTTPPAGPS